MGRSECSHTERGRRQPLTLVTSSTHATHYAAWLPNGEKRDSFDFACVVKSNQSTGDGPSGSRKLDYTTCTIILSSPDHLHTTARYALFNRSRFVTSPWIKLHSSGLVSYLRTFAAFTQTAPSRASTCQLRLWPAPGQGNIFELLQRHQSSSSSWV